MKKILFILFILSIYSFKAYAWQTKLPILCKLKTSKENAEFYFTWNPGNSTKARVTINDKYKLNIDLPKPIKTDGDDYEKTLFIYSSTKTDGTKIVYKWIFDKRNDTGEHTIEENGTIVKHFKNLKCHARF